MAAQQHSPYTTLVEYQTRLIALHGASGNPESQLVCNLHVVDLLRPEFGAGLGMHSLAGGVQRGRLIEYDALSYCWGGSTATCHLQCNGKDLRIMQNLQQALLNLRRSDSTLRWLWVDAICINQADDDEKAMQIPNMMYIYQQASHVIAWLGTDVHHLRVLQDIANTPNGCTDRPSSKESKSGEPSPVPYYAQKYCLATICEALVELYNRPYFQRIWVQQEIFAATHLRVCCGEVDLSWTGLIIKPTLLIDTYVLPDNPNLLLMPEEQADQICKGNDISSTVMSLIVARAEETLPRDFIYKERAKKKRTKHPIKIDNHVLNRLRLISEVVKIYEERVGCFHAITDWAQTKMPVELVDGLLLTGSLQATKPQDKVYGLLSMTSSTFPSNFMTLEEWIKRDSILPPMIPVNYTITDRTLHVVIMRLLLKEGGLALLAKFKVIAENDENDTKPCLGTQLTRSRPASALPSWVVDWQLASTVFRRDTASKARKEDYKLHRIHNVPELHDCWNEYSPAYYRHIRPRGFQDYPASLTPRQPHKEHVRFCEDNLVATLGGDASSALEKLVVRGCIEHQFFFNGHDVVCYKEPKKLTAWRMDFVPDKADLLISPEAFKVNSYNIAGFWYLRPADLGTFTLKAILSWSDNVPIYRQWKFSGMNHQAPKQCHRFVVPPLLDYASTTYSDELSTISRQYHPSTRSSKTQKFTIV